MKHILLHSGFDITPGGLVTNALEKNNEVFLQQGSIDGACGPYCVFMALLILGEIDRDEATEFWNTKQSTRFGKLVKGLQTHSALFNEGTNLEELETLLINFNKKLEIESQSGRGKQIIQFLHDELANDKIVVVGIEGKELHHWLLAIGYEETEKGKLKKVYCLDPSDDLSNGYFNATLKVDEALGGIYPYEWVDYGEENKRIQLEQAISLSKRKRK